MSNKPVATSLLVIASVAACGSDGGDDSEAVSDEASVVDESSGAGPLYDPAVDGEIPEGRFSREGLGAHLDGEHATAAWYPSIDNVSISGGDLQIGLDGDVDQAVEVCEAGLGYTAGFDDARLEIVTVADSAVLVAAAPGGPCRVAPVGTGVVVDEEPDTLRPDEALYSEAFDGPVDPEQPSVDGLKLFFDAVHTRASWRMQLTSWAEVPRDGVQVFRIGTEAPDAAMPTCEAALEYLARYGGFTQVEIVDGDATTDLSAEDPALVVRGDLFDGCV